MKSTINIRKVEEGVCSDEKASDANIIDNIDLCHSITRSLIRRLGTPEHLSEDLLSAAMVGLTEAARRSNTNNKKKFRTYASWRTMGAVIDELRRMGFYSVSTYKKLKRLYPEAGQFKLVEYLSEEEKLSLMDDSLTPEQEMMDSENKAIVGNAIKQLSEFEKQIIHDHYYNDRKLTSLTTARSLSSVSRSHRNALKKLKKTLCEHSSRKQ